MRIMTVFSLLGRTFALKKSHLFFLILTFSFCLNTLAQGAQGIDVASAELDTYIDPVSNLILAIGAVVGLIGGVRVYIKWNSGDQDVQKAIMGWFGSALFLVLVGVVIRAFFGAP